MNKLYLAIYDEQKLIADFLHNNLERLHQYDVIFSAAKEDLLDRNLTAQVSVLVFHVPRVEIRLITMVKKVLNEFQGLKILIYSENATAIEASLVEFSMRFKVVSVFGGYADFFHALYDLIPDHKNHRDDRPEKSETHEYLNDGFDRIRKNRKRILILKCIQDGMKPKEMDGFEGLKLNSINTYIERMMDETGCRNHTELVLQARKRGII